MINRFWVNEIRFRKKYVGQEMYLNLIQAWLNSNYKDFLVEKD